jgi:TolA-binding protein
MEVAGTLKDITFACAHCAAPLVIDAAAAGLTLPCQQCGKPTPVPDIPSMGGRDRQKANARVTDVRQQLKENESQRTEVTGYINQLTIQLHRWQLRLQTLEERRKDLEAQVESSKSSH